MIYLASRSHRKYLNKLREISARTEPFHIVSITGGLAFLHALNSHTLSLRLVDGDPEVNEYAQCMLEVITHCKDRKSFFGLLSGREVEVDAEGTLSFSAVPFSRRQLLISNLSTRAKECLDRWYNPDNFQESTSTIVSEERTIHFFGLSLNINHFNWHANWGCFESDQAYQELVKNLQRLEPRFFTMMLENYDFSTCSRNTLVLASNTDSPLFTKCDVVLAAVENSGHKSCFYVSRTRDYSRPTPAVVPLKDSILKVAPLTVGLPPFVTNEIEASFPFGWHRISFEDYYASTHYDLECIIYWVADEPTSSYRALIEHLRNDQPIHQRIGLAAHVDNQSIRCAAELLNRYQFQEKVHMHDAVIALYSLTFRIPY
jgi:hypothetical protein